MPAVPSADPAPNQEPVAPSSNVVDLTGSAPSPPEKALSLMPAMGSICEETTRRDKEYCRIRCYRRLV
ncbi:hypothetical protein BT69DRAFT_1344966 [Atractiella rhizophila]|nr:hypothetical protein BT69DRAFT_1344966 [Atractiella rhizophila]